MLLDSEDFELSEQVKFEFRDALRNIVNELGKSETLYSQTLREYLKELGKILFKDEYSGPDEAEAALISFMAVITEYRSIQECRYSSLSDLVDDVE